MDNFMEFKHTIIQNIVKEQDEDTIKMIENYIKEQQKEGKSISSKIIPEGKLRHIINLGVTLYNDMQHKRTTPDDLLDEQKYVEYLKQQLEEQTMKNQKLKNQIKLLEDRRNIEYKMINKETLRILVNSYAKDQINVNKVKKQAEKLFGTDDFMLLYEDNKNHISDDILDFPYILSTLTTTIQKAFGMRTEGYLTDSAEQYVFDFLCCDIKDLDYEDDAFSVMEKELNEYGYIFGGTNEK